MKNSEILEQAKKIVCSIKSQTSLNLPTVCSEGQGKVLPWRLNGHLPEHPLHKMISRVGAFPPALPRYYIYAYSKLGEFVADPFCGKGTTLLEACKAGRNALGCDIAPEAIIASRAKTQAPSIAAVMNYMQSLGARKEASEDREDSGLLTNEVKLFFSETTYNQLRDIRFNLLEDMRSSSARKRKLAEFVMGILLGLLHGNSKNHLSLSCNSNFAMSPNYVRKYVKKHNLIAPERNVKECLSQRILELLPVKKLHGKAWVYNIDASQLSKIRKKKWMGKVSLIVTSPPYLNRQTYVRDAWLRLWCLGIAPHKVKAKSLETSSIEKYRIGILAFLEDALRLLKVNGHCFLVCGKARTDVKGQDTMVHTGHLIALCAKQTKIGKSRFKIEGITKDRLRLRRGSYFAVHHGKSERGVAKSRMTEDEIIHLKKVESKK